MAEVSLQSNLSTRTAKYTGEALRLLRSLITFLVVLIVLALLWQGIKAVFRLDNLTLPNLSDIVASLSSRIAPEKPTLGETLISSALYTFREAVIGFALGATVGFVLAVIFVHSRLLERGLMPFVVASQTVPILAIAPMVVVWLGPTASDMGIPWASVAVISAYLTFFPVTINTLRGLVSVPPVALELMQSYAATRRDILFKLRIPNALPYIFTALKVSATASVVGAIIGELPSGIQDGLGGAILTFNQYYTSAPPRLWATNLVAALTGIVAFAIVALVERIVVRWSRSEQSS